MQIVPVDVELQENNTIIASLAAIHIHRMKKSISLLLFCIVLVSLFFSNSLTIFHGDGQISFQRIIKSKDSDDNASIFNKSKANTPSTLLDIVNNDDWIVATDMSVSDLPLDDKSSNGDFDSFVSPASISLMTGNKIKIYNHIYSYAFI